jgi:hypothetical protein
MDVIEMDIRGFVILRRIPVSPVSELEECLTAKIKPRRILGFRIKSQIGENGIGKSDIV